MASVLVGIPNKNQEERFFRECLESLKNQTFKDFRVVVIDSSTDNIRETEALVKSYGFEWIHYTHDLGIGLARNEVIACVHNESYIAYLSSDDAWEPDYLQVMYNVAQEHPNTILYSNYFLMDEYSNPTQMTTYKNYDTYEDFVMAVVEASKLGTMFVCYNLFSPVKLLQDCSFNSDKRLGEDLQHLLEATLVYKQRFHCIEKHLFRYRLSGTSTTTLKLNSIRENNIDTFRRINQKIGYKLFMEG